MSLKGAPELIGRLKATKLAFKAAGKAWADEDVRLTVPTVPVRPASMRAGDKHAPGRLRDSIRRKSATQKKAVVGGHYTAYFVDAGVKAHSMAKRLKKGEQRTVFTKRGAVQHPGYPARPFRARLAHEALENKPISESVIKAWNDAA